MIPKIFHRVWLGGNRPDEVEYHWETAKKLHPDWEFMTHSEQNLNEFPISKANFELDKSYCFKSDMIRYEAVHKYGGFYIDTDVEVIKNFDSLCNTEKVVVGYEDWNNSIVGSATFGSPPKNKELMNALNYMLKKALNEKKINGEFILTKDSLAFAPRVLSTIWRNNKNVNILPKEAFHILGGRKIDFKTLDLSNVYSVHKSAGSWL